MPSPFLTAICRGTSGGDPVVGRMVGLSTFQPVGDQTVFAAVGLEDVAPSALLMPRDRVRQIGDRIFFWHKSAIYQLIAGAWTSVYTLSPAVEAGDTQAHHSGLYFWQDIATGNFGLAGVYRQASFFTGLKYDYLTDTWSTSVSAFTIGGNSPLDTTFVYRNRLFTTGDNTFAVHTYDPITGSFTQSANITANINSHFLVTENKLFLWIVGSTNGILRQLVGGAWVVVASISGLQNDTQGWQEARCQPYYHGGSIWVIAFPASNDYARIWEIALPSFTVTERTATVLPVYLRTSNATGTTETEWRFSVVSDQEDSLGNPRTLILWQSDSAQGGLNVFEHTGITAWTDLGASQLTGEFSTPNHPMGGSDGIYSPGELFSLIRLATPSPNGVDLTVRFWGDPGPNDKFGRIRYDQGEGVANSVADLAVPASGLVSPMTLVGDQFETTDADGTTDYLLKHETIADGIPNAQPISYFVEVEKP